MKLAESGLPKGGGVGYEIFDKSDALGATSFIQNINHLRALEGELARTIRSLDRVRGRARASGAARPAAVLARKDRASASIVLKVRGTLGAAAGARHPPSGRLRRQRPQARSASRSSTRPASCSPTAPATTMRCDGRRRRAQGRLREPPAQARSKPSFPRWSAPAARACSSPPISTSTASPRPPTNTIPTAAWCARARRARRSRRRRRQGRRPGLGQQRIAGRRQQHQRRPAATRARRPRKSSITRFRAPPRPR